MTALLDPELELAFAHEAYASYGRFAARGVTLDDFAHPQARLVLSLCDTLGRALQPITTAALVEGLQRAQLDANEAMDLLFRCEAEHIRRPLDADRLRQLRQLRQLQQSVMRLNVLVQEERLHEALAFMGETRDALLQANVDKRWMYASEMVETALASVAEGCCDEVPLGVHGLTETPGSVVVVAGNTNVGKSSFCLEMMFGAAKEGVKSAMLSCEDPLKIINKRLLSALSGVSARQIQRKQLDSEEWRRLSRASMELHGMGESMAFADCIGKTEMDLCGLMTVFAAMGMRLFIIDYLGVVRASRMGQDRRNEVTNILITLKEHAVRLNVVLVVVSQLRRPPDGNPNREPTKHDLKESGDIENGAERLLLLWRETEADDAVVHVKVAKSKLGGTGNRWSMQRLAPSMRLQELP